MRQGLADAWVVAHDNPHGIEVKVGVVHTGSAAIGRTRRRLCQRRYVATTSPQMIVLRLQSRPRAVAGARRSVPPLTIPTRT
jgi:hypothetical protein